MEPRAASPSLFLRRPTLKTILCAAALLTTCLAAQAQPPATAGSQTPTVTYARLPLHFEPNQGLTEPQAKFIARGRGYTLLLSSTEAVLRLTDEASAPSVLRLKLVGANRKAKVTGLDELPGKSNYFLGNDSTKWRTGVPHDARVRVEQVYPGIDLVYYGTDQRQLEYDFIVAPGANPRNIRLRAHGSDQLEISAEGDLVLRVKHGEVCFRRPTIYQEVDGARRPVTGRFVQRGKDEVGFEVAAYDTAQPLVLDPVLTYSTYLGGSGGESAWAVAVDASGYVYLTGVTSSSNFPITPGAYDPSRSSGDAFVTKLDVSGTALIYSTFLGGSSNDDGRGIAVDGAGNTYITGVTSSFDFPTTLGAFDTSRGGTQDAFVTKLNPTGSALVYSTYLGGSSGTVEGGSDVAVDSAGNAYVVGTAYSSDFPTTPGAYDTSYDTGGVGDAFVTKLNPSGSALVYSTLLGGSDSEGGYAIAVDSSGNAYVTGLTESNNFPTVNAFRPTGGVLFEAFVTKLNAAGSALVYSTYLPGSGDDVGNDIAVDALGGAYVTGHTRSTNFPTANPFQASCARDVFGSCYDAFVTKFTPAGNAVTYSTYLGGGDSPLGNSSSWDLGYGIAVDAAGNAYVTGMTEAIDFPTANPIQATYGGGNCDTFSAPCGDVFVTKLNPTGAGLVFSTYLGGSGTDHGFAIAVDAVGNAYVVGTAPSSNFPVTNAFQPVIAGGGDAFVAKLSAADAPGIALGPTTLSFGTQAVGSTSTAKTVRLTSAGSQSLLITNIQTSGDFAETDDCGSSVPAGAVCSINVTFSPTATGARSGTVTIAHNAAGSPHTITLSGTGDNPVPTLTVLSPAMATRGGPEFTLTVKGTNFVSASVVRWNGTGRPTTYVDGTQLTADIGASDIATGTSAQVSVGNPSPGGGISSSLTFTINSPPAGSPAVNPGGAVNGASFAPGAALAPGSITAVFGTNLASATEYAGAVPLPTSLGGANMICDGIQPVPKFFASAFQINIQMPWELAGHTSGILTDTVGGMTSSSQTFALAPFAPGIFAANAQGFGQGAILIANTPFLAAPSGAFPGSRPAVRGTDFLEIYWTGGGAVSPPVATGAAASASPLTATTTTPSVTIGGVSAPVLFSGLAPGYVGLYVATLKVPTGAPTGSAVPVVLSIGGATANTVTIAIQ